MRPYVYVGEDKSFEAKAKSTLEDYLTLNCIEYHSEAINHL